MTREQERQVEDLADSYIAGGMSRRVFITRLLALGLSVSAAGAVLAACSSAASPAPAASATAALATGAPATPAPSAVQSLPSGLKGEIRFLIGPWTDKEVEHQQVIQAAFNKINPDVTFTYKLWDWTTADVEMSNALNSGSHDIFYVEDHTVLAFADRLADLTARINDPAFKTEHDKYLYWDRLSTYGDKLVGLPNNWAIVDMLFANMDMVQAAGYDDTFVKDWDTFVAALKKMTTPDIYGLGIGIQLGPTFGEWYQWLRGAGGSFLTPDQKSTNVNLPAVVETTKQFADLYKQGIAPPIGTYDYNTGGDAFLAGKLAVYSTDTAGLGARQPKFNWKLLPYPPGSASRQNMFSILGTYTMSQKTPDQDLGWEVLKWWTNSDSSAYWCDVSGPWPARSDALQHGYGATAAPQLADAYTTMQQYAMGAEPFAKWNDCEAQAEQQIGRVWTGEVTPEEGVANVESTIKKIVFG